MCFGIRICMKHKSKESNAYDFHIEWWTRPNKGFVWNVYSQNANAVMVKRLNRFNHMIKWALTKWEFVSICILFGKLSKNDTFFLCRQQFFLYYTYSSHTDIYMRIEWNSQIKLIFFHGSAFDSCIIRLWNVFIFCSVFYLLLKFLKKH